MTTESYPLSIVGDGVSFRRTRVPTVVTDLYSAASLAQSVDVSGINGTSDTPTTASRTSSSTRRWQSVSVPEDGRLAQFHGGHSADRTTSARTNKNGRRSGESTVVLLCSGRNCLETAAAHPTSNLRSEFGAQNDARASGVGFQSVGNAVANGATDRHPSSIRRLSRQRTITSSSLITTARDPVHEYDFGGSYRSSSNGGLDLDNEDAFDRRHHQRGSANEAAAVAAATTARQHIRACQLPGSVKRSSRVTSDLSNLMSALREHQNQRLSSVDRKTRPPHHSEPPYVDEEAVVPHLQLPFSGRSSPTRGFSGSRRPLTSAGRRSAARGFGAGHRQPSSLSAADVSPLLCITSLELPSTNHTSSGNVRLSAAV